MGKTKQPPLEIDYAILCEDIRKEHNNKVMLSGIYTGQVLVGEFPARLRLSVWFHGIARKSGSYNVRLKIASSSARKDQFAIKGLVDVHTAVRNDLEEIGFGAAGALVPLNGPGELTVHYKIDDQPRWRRILKKHVDLLTVAQPPSS